MATFNPTRATEETKQVSFRLTKREYERFQAKKAAYNITVDGAFAKACVDFTMDYLDEQSQQSRNAPAQANKPAA